MGWSALLWAASAGRENIVHILLQRGADINATDQVLRILPYPESEKSIIMCDFMHIQRGLKAINIATTGGHTSAVKVLIDWGLYKKS